MTVLADELLRPVYTGDFQLSQQRDAIFVALKVATSKSHDDNGNGNGTKQKV